MRLPSLLLLATTALLCSCKPDPVVVYRIPEAKKEVAAHMVEALVESNRHSFGTTAREDVEAATIAAFKVYGEPVLLSHPDATP